MTITKILVPTDLTEASIPVLQRARFVAERFGAEITLLYVEPENDPHFQVKQRPGSVFTNDPLVFAPATQEESQKLAADIRAAAERWLSGIAYESVVAMGHPSTIIKRVAEQRRVDLIVMGTHARQGIKRLVAGSIAESVLHNSRVPVLTVGPKLRKESAGAHRIVCPVNRTSLGRESVAYAAELAEAFGSELVVVRVAHGETIDATADEAKLRAWFGSSIRWTYKQCVVRAATAERVCAFLDDLDADLLVVGAERRFLRDTTVTGTTPERLVRIADVPVVTIMRDPVPVHFVATVRATA